MGEVIRKTHRGRFIGWYVRYVDSDGKRKAKATKATTAAQARRILCELEAQAARRQLGVMAPPPPITGVALLLRWLAEAQPRTTDRTAWVARQRHTLAKVWPELDALISPSDAHRILRSLGGYAPGTVKNTLVALKAAWRWAMSVGLAASNPWSMRVPTAAQRVEYLSREEVVALLGAADADREVLAVAVRLAVYAGLRCGEVFGLCWRDLDFERGVLRVRHSYRGAPTKSRRERCIPMAEPLREVLLRAWQTRGTRSDYVCPSQSGGAIAERPDIHRLYHRAGLTVPSAPWHVLRHTFASHFLMSGGSLLTLARLLGHSSVTITQIYSHLSDAHVASELRRLKF